MNLNKTNTLSYFIFTTLLISSAIQVLSFEAYYRNDDFKMATESSNTYFNEIQPILDKRCIVCHACREADCQLKLTSPEGLARGGNTANIEGGGLKRVNRNKLFHDANSIKEWRKLGFYSVLDNEKGSEALFVAALTNKSIENEASYVEPEIDFSKNSCGIGNKDLSKVVGMPYKTAPLDYYSELLPLISWATNSEGVKFPTKKEIQEAKIPNNQEAVSRWENFFNDPSSKAQWSSRFLYEHLYFAKLYIEESPGDFFQIVRSSTQYPEEIKVLPTVHVWEDPGKKEFYYRLQKVHSSIVYKNHFVYEINDKELTHLKDLFWNANWEKGSELIELNYIHGNPLVAMKHVPAKARYTWMLENSHMLLDISARSQNCRSESAGSPYWDNMIHLFVKPDSDASVVYGKEFYDKAGKHLPIPSMKGGQKNPFKTYHKPQLKYSKVKREFQDKLKPNGYTVEDVWNGNPNSLVTVLRHQWVASAHKGQWGNTPRSFLLLDFANFERYFYLCNNATEVSDGMLWQSRVVTYLFDVKREAEDNFLSLVPNRFRDSARKSLVQDWDIAKEFKAPFALPYNKANDIIGLGISTTFKQFSINLIKKHFSKSVIGKHSYLLDEVNRFKEFSGHKGFAQYMPSLTYLRVKEEDESKTYYTMTANRYYISRNKLPIISDSNFDYERKTRKPQKDTMAIFKGIHVNYPEKIYTVKRSELNQFLTEMKGLRSRSKFLSFNQKYGVNQRADNFWNIIDEVNSIFISTNPITGGVLDLHRYGRVESQEPI